MKRILIILMLVSLAHQGWTQQTSSHQFSSAPETARFEMVQSGESPMLTFKIDKYNGRVYRLIVEDEGVSWMIIPTLSEVNSKDKKYPNQVNYQIFTSGHSVVLTYLINVNTGLTWQLYTDPDIGTFWGLVE